MNIKKKKNGRKSLSESNADGRMIKILLAEGFSPKWITKKLGFSKQKISFWKNNEIKEKIIRKTKLEENEINDIIKLAENQTTSNMPSRKIATIVNQKLKNEGKNITIGKSTICRYLNKRLGKPRKIQKVFSLNEKKKKQRVEYCQKILDKKIKSKDLFFTDETKIDCSPFINEKIRLSKENTEKLKKGDPEAYKLINKQSDKFPKRIILAGGISFYGLSDLILLEGTMNEFSYAQAILYYNENLQEFKKKNKNIIFEQDGASCHTSKNNKALLNKIFGEEGWIQNPPNSPDLAYPIETLWANLKKNVKERNPKNYNDLKQYCIEEWNKINPKQYFKHFIKRIEKCIELNGEKLENFHLTQIRKENDEIESEENEEENKRILKLKRVFNDIILRKLKKNELKALKKKKKEMIKKYNQKIKENKIKIKEKEDKKKEENKGILLKKKRGRKKKEEEEKEIDLNDMTEINKKLLPFNKKDIKTKIEMKIKKIEPMDMEEYLKYYLKEEKRKEKKMEEKEEKRKKKKKQGKEEEEEEEDEDYEEEEKKEKEKEKEQSEDNDEDEDTIDEKINEILDKITKVKNFKKDNKEISYKLNFK